jgi:hypothetical protein
MFKSKTIGLSIERPVGEVYEFLLEPRNFPSWAFPDANMTHLGGTDWQLETSVGPRIIRFAERNPFGILDHATMRAAGERPHPIAMRVVANATGTELIYTSFKRDDFSDAEWDSMLEWVMTDLMSLKTLLESRP